ncbi:BTAD domain-containing putative transcriptional regulator [Actinomycetospora sp. NBRC 106375]|uniref:BTAD domain-containing putative transcriptional regulator n=1 Tax=Actinomycetospora sp. NBRC 106375 TaxID=3032207 RepID=UPI0025546D46|nr:BTAD domain-containing putative transcriptional regulator [Actinomycetospora sp. NBRC 106375]
MEFRDLGPLLVEDDDLARPPGGARLSTVLAVLLARVGETVAAPALVEAIWGADASARSVKVLESHIWRLRKILEPDRGPRAAPTVLRTEPTGYRLAVDPAHLDSHRLVATSASARALLLAGRHGEVLAASEQALARWRGPFCEDVADTGWLAPVRERFSDLRLDLAEHRADALMAVGQPERAAHELAALVSEHPLRERLWERRILGLYRSGRQAAALAAHDQVRRLLAEELGVDPGPALADLHQRILTHADGLRPPPAPETERPAVDLRLPGRRRSILGRDTECAEIASRLRPGALVTVLGPGGVGKTRLATEVAAGAGDRFPDGVWFVDLAPVTVADAVPAAVADALALSPVPGASAQDVVAAHLADRRALVLLDNCEHLIPGAGALVDRLLDRCPGTAVLATSREPLEVAGEVRHLLGPLPVPDGPPEELATSAVVRLFLERAADDRPDLDPGGPDGPLLRRICAAVGGLPLAVELAAARARSFELAEIAESLERSPGDLARSGPGPDRHATLLETVAWSYRLAGPDEQVLHRRLAVLPGPFTLEGAAALCRPAPLRAEQALDLLGGLAHRSLVTAVRPGTAGRATTFTQLVPIRAHADQVLAPGEREAATAARDRWVLDSVAAGPLPGAADQPAFYDWLDDNVAAVRACLRSLLVERPDPAGPRLAARLLVYWHDRERLVELSRWAQAAGDAAPVLAGFDRAVAGAVRGCADALAHDADAADGHLAATVPALAVPPVDRAPEAARLLFVIAICAWSGDAIGWATDAARAAVAVAERAGDRHTVLGGRAVLAASALLAGDADRAVALADAVLADNRAVGNQLAALFAEVTHSIAALFAADGAAGLRHGDAVLRTQLRLGTRNFAESLESRGAHLAHAGQPEEAARTFAVSSALSARQGRTWPWHPGTEERLAAVRAELGPDEFAGHWASGLRTGRLDPTELVAGLVLDGPGVEARL